MPKASSSKNGETESGTEKLEQLHRFGKDMEAFWKENPRRKDKFDSGRILRSQTSTGKSARINEPRQLSEFEKCLLGPDECMMNIPSGPAKDYVQCFKNILEFTTREAYALVPKKTPTPLPQNYWFWFSCMGHEKAELDPALVQMREIVLRAQSSTLRLPSPLIFYNWTPNLQVGISLKGVSGEKIVSFIEKERDVRGRRAVRILEKRMSFLKKRVVMLKSLEESCQKSYQTVKELAVVAKAKGEPLRERKVPHEYYSELMKLFKGLLKIIQEKNIIPHLGVKFLYSLAKSRALNYEVLDQLDPQSLGYLIAAYKISMSAKGKGNPNLSYFLQLCDFNFFFQGGK